MARSGKCTSIGICSKADSGETLSIAEGNDFVCPECGSTLSEITSHSSNFVKKFWRIIVSILTFLVTTASFYSILFQLFPHLFGYYSLKIIPEPADAKIEIQDSTQTYSDGMTLKSQEYKVLVSKDKYESKTTTILLNKDVVEKVVLQPQKGKLVTPYVVTSPLKSIHVSKAETLLAEGLNYINSSKKDNGHEKNKELKNALAKFESAYDYLREVGIDCDNVQNLNDSAYELLARITSNRGNTHLILNQPHLAYDDIIYASKCSPENRLIQYSLAICYIALNEEDRALPFLEKALTPPNPINTDSRIDDFCGMLTEDFKSLKNKDGLKSLLKSKNSICAMEIK